MCAEHEMVRGVHCANFTAREEDSRPPTCWLGVVGTAFNPASPNGGEREGANQSAGAWMMYTGDGELVHGGSGSEWAGQPEEIKAGDVVVRRPPCAAPLGVLRGGCVRAGHGARPRRRQVRRMPVSACSVLC